VVIGAGATGGHVAMQLSMLGLTDQLYVIDDDKVSHHNLSNQVYFEDDVDLPKVVALRDLMICKGSNNVPKHNFISERVPNFDIIYKLNIFKDLDNPPCVILAVDTMKDRQAICEYLLESLATPIRVIDTRMAATHGNVFSFELMSQYSLYRQTFIKDDEAEMSPCGAVYSVIPTVQLISSVAVWEYIHLCNNPLVISEVSHIFANPVSIKTQTLNTFVGD
jgi:molybdopterin/thiamine biosynthesis adenylyltransferase